jgi:adenine-specific DNA-methyltransferase
MTKRLKRLELTWIGKEERPRLEPRIFLEDEELSYANRVSHEDIFDNRLIHGDNLLALKALEHEFTGKIKCVYIDPPYNTGYAFEHYDDGLEHSLWLGLMRARLEVLHKLLSKDGSIWISIDDQEAHYLKVLCDEVFGRANFVCSIVVSMNPKGRQLDRFFAGSHEYVLCFAKDKANCSIIASSTEEVNFADFPEADAGGRFRYLPLRNTNKKFNPETRRNLHYPVFYNPETKVLSVEPAGRGIEILPVFGDGKPAVWRWGKEKLEREKCELAVRQVQRRTGGAAYDLFQKDYCPDDRVKKLKSVWLSDAIGSTDEAKTEVKALSPDNVFGTPKPERLLRRILESATVPGDTVLDSFLGSGTSAAVAHKMGRRWIGVELGDHAVSLCAPRLRKVVDGLDRGGVTEVCEWKGGGGFRFFRLAPSLLEKDKWGNWIVSKQYKPEMLAEAMCKLEGFRYAPHREMFWNHGHSTERDFIYVTTQNLSPDQLRFISEQVGPERTLLICCSAFRGKPDFSNLTVKKIPHAVLTRCEWGKDDYSLNVTEQAPVIAAEESKVPGNHDGKGKLSARRKKGAPMQELPLFAGLAEDKSDGGKR